MSNRLASFLLLPLIGVVLLTACGDAGDDLTAVSTPGVEATETQSTPEPPTPTPTPIGTDTPQGQGDEVEIEDFEFRPQVLQVAVGVEVEWKHRDSAPHTATADDGSFDSGTLRDDAEFRHTFTEPGEFPYHCEIHPSMTGTIVVS